MILLMTGLIFSTPLSAETVFEDFKNGAGGFKEINSFSVFQSRFLFKGNRTDNFSFAEWDDASNPGGWASEPKHPNYFADFEVSVNAVRVGGSEAAGYGLTVCNHKKTLGTHFVNFYIEGVDGVNSTATYTIEVSQELALPKKIVEQASSSAILPNQSNLLSIFKIGNHLSFSINGRKIKELVIEACIGGSIGVQASNLLDVAFDNFRLSRLSPFATEYFDEGLGGFQGQGDLSFMPSKGQMLFLGDDSDEMQSLAWNGGNNQGGEWPSPGHTNYFKNFNASVDVRWDGGSDSDGYGISVCNQKNSLGKADHVIFQIREKGDYTISTTKNQTHKTLVDWTQSPLIVKHKVNKLSIAKNGDQLSFYINAYNVQQFVIEECVGGSIVLEAFNKIETIAFDNFVVTNFFESSLAALPPSTNKPPIASFSMTPSSGKAPLIVNLDASASSDSDGNVEKYHWTTSDGQTAETDKTTTITFHDRGTHTISLIVTDNLKTNGEPFQRTVTVGDAIPSGDLGDDGLFLAIQGLQASYKLGEKLQIKIAQRVHRSRFERVDLWVAIQMPDGKILYRTSIPVAPYSPNPQPFKASMDNFDDIENFMEFEVSHGLGGKYIFYAAYVVEKTTPFDDSPPLKYLELVSQETTLPK
jgi:PKD repeat protein